MTLRLDHVGLAVRHAPNTLDVLGRLIGVQDFATEDIEQQGLRIYLVSAGAAKLELLEGLTRDSPVSRFLAKRGEGMHHLAFEVPNIRDWMQRVRAAGFAPLTESPLRGANGKLIFFLHPADTHGVLFEFCQVAEQECVVAIHAEDHPGAVPALGSGFRLLGVSKPEEAVAALADAEAHIVATDSAAGWAMELARDYSRRVRSLVVYNPERFEVHSMTRVFLICSTEEPQDLDRILAAHRAMDGSQLAVLPRECGIQSRVVARLITQFFSRQDYGGTCSKL